MVAEVRRRRSKTARELAEKYGITIRHVKNIVAEPREDYLRRARERKETVLDLRVQGLKVKEIAEKTGIPMGTVGTYIAQAKKDGILEEKIILKKTTKKRKKVA